MCTAHHKNLRNRATLWPLQRSDNMAKKVDWTKVGLVAVGGGLGFGLDYVLKTYAPQVNSFGKWVTPAISALTGLALMYFGDEGMMGDLGAGMLAYGTGRVIYTLTVTGSAS
jgi:hypothetical protein